MTEEQKMPAHLERGEDGVVRDKHGGVYEIFEGAWREVKDGARDGWWRFHRHYDRDGYCDNPARGY